MWIHSSLSVIVPFPHKYQCHLISPPDNSQMLIYIHSSCMHSSMCICSVDYPLTPKGIFQYTHMLAKGHFLKYEDHTFI